MKKLLKVFLAIFMAVSITACGSKENDKDALDAIIESGKLVIATSPDYYPYEFYTMENGTKKIVGCDIALAQAIADKLGVELVVEAMEFDNVLLSISNGTVNLGISALSPTAERLDEMDFSKEYYNGEVTVLIRKADKDKYTSLNSFGDAKVGAQIGSLQLDYAKTINSNPIAGKQLYNIALDLQIGNIDAFVVGSTTAEKFVEEMPDLYVTGFMFENESAEGLNVAMPKGNNEKLIAKLDEIIDELISTGEFDKFMAEASGKTEVNE